MNNILFKLNDKGRRCCAPYKRKFSFHNNRIGIRDSTKENALNPTNTELVLITRKYKVPVFRQFRIEDNIWAVAKQSNKLPNPSKCNFIFPYH